jgi:uncharacterized RDD family membrane protein YckC
VIDTYVKDFSRWTVGSREHRETLMRELEAHLREAQEAGQLEEALERFGSPREAARVFSEGHPLQPAPLSRRLAAAAADLLPVEALLLLGYWQPGWPGSVYPLVTTRLVFIALAILWWNFVLPLSEWLTGSSPGKRLFGLRVVSDDGTALSAGQAFLRRVPVFLAFPLLVVDLPTALVDGRHRRAFDRVAGTLVVADREEEPPSLKLWKRRSLLMNLVLYLFVNLGLIVLWGIVTDVLGLRFFWLIFPLLGWGIGLAVYAWETLARGRS